MGDRPRPSDHPELLVAEPLDLDRLSQHDLGRFFQII